MPVVDFHIHAYDWPISAPASFVEFMDREMARAYGSFARFVEHYTTGAAYETMLDEAGVDYGVILAELAPITSAIASNETVTPLCAGSNGSCASAASAASSSTRPTATSTRTTRCSTPCTQRRRSCASR